MNDKDFHRKILEAVYRMADYPPIFKPNPRHCINQFAKLTPYISYNDIKKNKVVIRGNPIVSGDSVDCGKRDVIIEYSSIGELVDDGWQVDY